MHRQDSSPSEVVVEDLIAERRPSRAAPAAYKPVSPTAMASPKTNTLAILSLVFGFVFWPLGILFGHLALRQIRRTREAGRGLAFAGLILGYVVLAFLVVAIVVLAIAGSHSSTTNS
jgi:hypothetical protein